MSHHWPIGACATVLAVVAACLPRPVAEAITPSEKSLQTGISTAAPAAQFTDSVGVATHWGYTDTPYSSAYDRVKQALVDSGIKHVRGRAFRAEDLHEAGIRTTVVVDSANNGQDPAAQVAAFEPLVKSGAVVAVEGPNEPDLFWTKNKHTYQGRGFPEGVVAFQRDLYSAVKDDPDTADLDVIGPSLGRRYWSGGMPYAPGTFSGIADFGNFHPYPSRNSRAPSTPYAGLSKYYWEADFPSITLDKYPIDLTTHQAPFRGREMMATESGYPTWSGGQSEKMQGRYMPRLFLENFRLGIRRTYAYELLDEFDDPARQDRESNFGLLRNDLTPKPAYYAMRSLLRAVADTTDGPPSREPVTPGGVSPLAATLTVTPPEGFDPEYLHHVALEKSDGTVVLALWHEVSGNDLSGVDQDPPQRMREVDQPQIPVQLDLGARADGVSVQTIGDDGRLRATPVQRAGSTYDFSVPDRVTLVTVPPSGGEDREEEGGLPRVRRVAGADREATAIAVARDRFSAEVPGAVLATRSDFADSLAGAPLTQQIGGPLLLTSARRLDDHVAAELETLVRPGGTVYLLGGPDALSNEVEADVEGLGLVVRRIAGADRFATAAAVAQQLDTSAGCDVLLVTGRTFADGTSAAGQASAQRPILYSDGGAIPEVTARALRDCAGSSGGVGRLTAVGGPAAAAVSASPTSIDGFAVSSVVGDDRYETSALLLGREDGATSRAAVLSNGADFPDALVGGTYGHPVLLTRRDHLPGSVQTALAAGRQEISDLIVVGGPSSVSDSTMGAAVAALRQQG